MSRPVPRPAPDATPRPEPGARPAARRRPLLAIGLSLGVHLALLPLVFLSLSEPPVFSAPPQEIDAITVSLTPPPPIPAPETPSPDPAPPASTPAASDPARAPRETPRPTPPSRAPQTRAARPVPPDVATIVANPTPSSAVFVGVGAAELAGATVAGPGVGGGSGTGTGAAGGQGGGPCDMVRRLQDALRDDPDIRRTAAEAQRALGPDRALLLWNGDWLQTPGQAGRGLAGVRQAIAVEVAFAPTACRRQTMRGLALITLGDTSDSPRIALGTANWRWGDLARGR